MRRLVYDDYGVKDGIIIGGFVVVIVVVLLGAGYAISLIPPSITEGTIIQKDYQAAYTRTEYKGVIVNDEQTSIRVPVQYPAVYRIIIENENEDGDMVTRHVDVPGENWQGFNVGDWFNIACYCIE